MSGYCDLKTGLCVEGAGPETEVQVPAPKPAATILYVTDPICSHCWAMEPAWRRLMYHYGSQVDVRYLYGGLLPGWKGFADAGNGIRKPADVAPHWEDVARYYGQPINPAVWLDDPVESSYPPSKAAHAVRLLDPAKEETFLRRIREAVFLEGRNIARPEVLSDCAADVGLDAALFARLHEAGAGQPGFDRDRAEMRQLPVRGFPTVIMVGKNEQARVLPGSQTYVRLEEALLAATGLAAAAGRPDAAAALAAYRSGTTLEFAELMQVSPDEATRMLEETGAIEQGHLWRAEQPS